MIDPDSIRFEVATRLPVHVRWLIKGVPLDFNFSRSQSSLRPITPIDLNGCDIEDEWEFLYLFGDENYAEGGGASPLLGVHRKTGAIFGLDIEREESQSFLLNSNIDRFIRTFQKLDETLCLPSIGPGTLSEALMLIDPEAFQRSEWRELVLHLAEVT